MSEQESVAWGDWRQQWVDHRCHGCEHRVPAERHGELDDWLGPILERAEGPCRGLDPATCPQPVCSVLQWAGVPIAVGGELAWGSDLLESSTERPFCDDDGTLLLPPVAELSELSSLALKPLRLFLYRRLGVRLQAGTALYLTLWANQALIVSRSPYELGGFLHGPNKGQRASLTVAPGGSQHLRF